jgi:hypothetical protein
MLYARILKEMGWLSKGNVIVKTPADFLGSHLGESEERTRGILAAAKGCVLVIDEAYGLAEDSEYVKAVVDTIVAKVQGVPGDDIAVLMLGYKDEMEAMLRSANPGLARRFRPDDAFVFEDYDDGALRTILLSKAGPARLEVAPAAADAAIALLARQRQKPRFGNGGAVENMLMRAKESLARRIGAAADAGAPLADARARRTLLPTDFDTAPLAAPEDALAGLVGAAPARAKLAGSCKRRCAPRWQPARTLGAPSSHASC